MLAVPTEGVSCDDESLHLEFTSLISTCCSSGGTHLEKYDLQYAYFISLHNAV